MATASPPPPPPHLEILVREPDVYSVWHGPPFAGGQPTVKLERTPCKSAQFSDDGSRLMVMKSDSAVGVYDCRGGSGSSGFREIRSFEVSNLVAATLSPRGAYVQTFQRPLTPQEKNVVLWKVDTGDSVYQLHQKNLTKSTWPLIRFSSDEAVACRLATNEIQFFEAGDFSKGIKHRLRIPGVAGVELSKTPGSHVAAFVPESKGNPASVQIYASKADLQTQAIARRSFFRCSSVLMNWNNGSTGLLVVAQSDVDKTNQSYYGESKLNYLTIDGTHDGPVSLRKEGPIHDVQWSHSGSEFAVVYGFMPAKATIFDKKCNPLLELGTGPYNTIRWNPKGKYLCLAGFGNLPGDMYRISMPTTITITIKRFYTCFFTNQRMRLSSYKFMRHYKAFWDYVEKKQLGTTKAEWSVTSEWSPDGCYFMTATTAPRLQVDNGIKIFHHNGALSFKKVFDKLYQADWKPESPDKFDDIAQLIKSVDNVKIEEGIQGKGIKPPQTSVRSTSTNPPGQKPAAYRPPHAKTTAAIQAELFGESPAETTSKNALKNKKKREKQREKKAADAASAAGSS